MVLALAALVGVAVVTFLLGSIPWGVVISKTLFHKDLRDEGSGNIGTTNAMRSLGKVGGAAVFLLDFGKGVLSGLIGSWAAVQVAQMGDVMLSVSGALGVYVTDAAILYGGWALAVALAGCVVGHIFSPWLGFHGGKGIAVAVGALFVVFGPIGACLELLIFIVLVVATRYVSVGSIAAAAACPLFSLYYFWGNWPAWLLCSCIGILVVWAHRENIARLRAGNENRIGSKKKEA